MKAIILGVFRTRTYNHIIQLTGAVPYPFDKLETGFSHSGIISLVHQASCVADKIYFSLDNIKLPLDPSISITCEELNHILNDPELLEKTEFWLARKQVEKQYVIDTIYLNSQKVLNEKDFSYVRDDFFDLFDMSFPKDFSS